jgi:Tfp pilus assembly protein PilX
VPAKTRRSGRGIALVIVLVSVAVIGFLLLVALVSRPVGTQVEMDGELDESYCQMFPEDCS